MDVIYKNDLIPEDYTLVDIAYHYNWRRDQPMQFFYRIFKKTKVLLKRRKRKMKTSETVSSGVEATTNKKSKSSTIDSDKNVKKSANAHQPPPPSINSSEGVRTCQTVPKTKISNTSIPSAQAAKALTPPQLNGKPNNGKTPSPNSLKLSTKRTSPLSNLYGKTTSEKFESLFDDTNKKN